MCSLQVQPLAGPIKWNRPSVTIWSAFQNTVTIIVYSVWCALITNKHVIYLSLAVYVSQIRFIGTVYLKHLQHLCCVQKERKQLASDQMMMNRRRIMSPQNSFKCSAYQLVDQNWHKMQSHAQSTYFARFLGGMPQTPMLCMLIVFHTMTSVVVTLSKVFVHQYYYYPQASNMLLTGIQYAQLYLHIILQFEHWATNLLHLSYIHQIISWFQLASTQLRN